MSIPKTNKVDAMTTYTTTPGVLPYRQAQTLAGIANGLTNKEMAAEAGISTSVIKNAVNDLFFKFHLSKGKRSLLVAEAMRTGCLTTKLLLVVCLFVSAVQDDQTERVQRRSTSRLTVRTLRTVRSGRKEAPYWSDLLVLDEGELS
ncbi:LuxR C-terminal-related transcriptional regulator [Oceanobacter sp. 3_MG-2023]|uniref:LuxR C-terminal-related transcriptional regulator n=1 Tax=Oceanobacter sp. 3_MG-2023 TaxID=3062622 RepID=UPI0027375AD2|nr:LuxR C-terminal-related transcriptional regulator [Oceanobacter sp. 3_MG-2023]MDP2505412.1 LuxR C-terminal-related transcriptional regulator [Oceanobacter sp. 3_MG-2023]